MSVIRIVVAVAIIVVVSKFTEGAWIPAVLIPLVVVGFRAIGRHYDQIRQSVAYSGKNVKICASHAGLTLGEDGATHQILEDIGLMKMLPGMTVIVPCDYSQTKAATKAIAEHQGPVYLRFGRPVWPIFTDNLEFTIGKAQVFSEGTDVSIFDCGHLVWKAIEAGKILQEKGISVEIINIQLLEKYGLTASHIVDAAEKVMMRK